jgi:acylpyruvate hydrolase
MCRSVNELTHLPPLPSPGKFAGVGLNYASHLAEGGTYEKPQFPGMHLRGPTTFVGHQQTLLVPKLSAPLDYEVELTFVIGTRARYVTANRALDHGAGYSIFNDASIRDYQQIPYAGVAGKNFAATGSFGPEFVTADEVPPGAHDLDISTRLNGELVQSDNTANMYWNVAQIIEIRTVIMTLEPGDLVVTGTCAGIGLLKKPPRFLEDGDLVEFEIEGFGVLRNSVASDARPE